MTRQVRRGEYSDEFFDDETGETWTVGEDGDMDEVDEDAFTECENCGEAIRADDESLAVVKEDGSVGHWCRWCLNRPTYSPERLIQEILEAAGVYSSYGWSDENEEECRKASDRQKTAGVPAKRVLLIQKGMNYERPV